MDGIAYKSIGLSIVILFTLLVYWSFTVSFNTTEEQESNKVAQTRQPNNVRTCNMTERLKRIGQTCNNMDIGTNITLYDVVDIIQDTRVNLYVDESHQVMYCPVTKSASTTFLKLVHNCKGKSSQDREPSTPFRAQYELPNLRHDYTREEMIHRLENYHKFMVVRHPFDRLVSAYNYLFQQGLQFSHTIAMVNRLGVKYFNRTFDTVGNKLQLEQFLQLVAEEPVSFLKPHWKTFVEFCVPCYVTYDHVIRLETIASDMDTLLDRLSDKNKKCSPAWKSQLRNTSDKMDEVTRLFSHVDRDIIKILASPGRYGRDMAVFGYTWDMDQGAGCQRVSKEGQCC